MFADAARVIADAGADRERMNEARTYYDLLGVSRSATARQIRSAYLGLMKCYHPDVANGDRGGIEFIPLITQSYAALSDPSSRAAYDAELDRRSRPLANLAGRRAPTWEGVRRRDLVAAIAIPLAVAGLALHEPIGREFAGLYARQIERRSQPPAPTFAHTGRLPFAAVQRAARMGGTLRPQEAVETSTGCFAAARNAGSSTATQLCIVFDDAFLYSRKRPEGWIELPFYYSDPIVSARHASALAPFNRAESLLKQLWHVTFVALMVDLGHSQGPSSDVGVGTPQRRPPLVAPGLAESQRVVLTQAGTGPERTE